jgi:hypothetical protein
MISEDVPNFLEGGGWGGVGGCLKNGIINKKLRSQNSHVYINKGINATTYSGQNSNLQLN